MSICALPCCRLELTHRDSNKSPHRRTFSSILERTLTYYAQDARRAEALRSQLSSSSSSSSGGSARLATTQHNQAAQSSLAADTKVSDSIFPILLSICALTRRTLCILQFLWRRLLARPPRDFCWPLPQSQKGTITSSALYLMY
eukprot:jgi/Mesen1/1077/ME000123S00249